MKSPFLVSNRALTTLNAAHLKTPGKDATDGAQSRRGCRRWGEGRATEKRKGTFLEGAFPGQVPESGSRGEAVGFSRVVGVGPTPTPAPTPQADAGGEGTSLTCHGLTVTPTAVL